MKLTVLYQEKFLVTRYQTVKLDETALEMAQAILDGAVINEQALIARFDERVEEHDTRLFVSKMLQVEALDLIGKVDYVAC
ncbi:MAG: hypothetical protein A3J66_00865 [Candidatus Magasanikbacteria bacterium RIFCSPHIGHO2_02_FULL_47_14]|uniref:Uncharacterized protein n=1 Tax=Candidatus Magasanikbacteria bacterium RIFCSPHIGHO2_02_FULL_47_14 TaxID=1798680 RepID=A0A1F6M7Z7_9BACT|nr:MAG: hypothetical protein A3J66_00865 [Candidatus Magasanikbacteria bacterium RIFCSPHIGHO2_02_FULL_47_14]